MKLLESPLKSAFHSSGGVIYHYLALKYRTKLWTPYIDALNAYLLQWKPKSNKVVLVGPSAGYCIQSDLFKNFKEMRAIDPDPIAAAVFKKRTHSDLRIKWDYQNYFFPQRGKFDPTLLTEFRRKYKGYSIFFTNSLGQLTLGHTQKDKNQLIWKDRMDRLLNESEWASFHDRISLSNPLHHLQGGFLSQHELSNAELIERFVVSERNQKPVVILDHQMGGFLPAGPRAYFSWEIYPGRFHLIEASFHSKN